MEFISFIRFNINIRFDELNILNKLDYHIDEECVNLLNSNDLIILHKIHNNSDIFYKISSKSFNVIADRRNFVVDRLSGLNHLLNNLNFKTKNLFIGIEIVGKYKYFLISSYIIAGQIFTDGNHRTVIKYLKHNGYDCERINTIINLIDNVIISKNVRWDNIHEFIQKLIDNIVHVINTNCENLLVEKIENLFI